MKVNFENEIYQLVITDHARDRMVLRNISENEISLILSKGKKVLKNKKNHFWVYKNFSQRADNLICLSVSIESPYLIVITTLVNWRPV